MKYHTTHLRRPLRHVRSSLGYGRRIWGLLGLLGCLLLSLLPQQAALANNGAAPNVLSLPAGPGSLGGVGENVQANLNMGLMSYSISVVMPKGRGQATPGINISYSSSAGASLMGIGWNFGAGGAVERLTVRGLPTYTNNDHFYSGGELVKIPGKTVYRARNEGGFVRYQWKQSSTTDKNRAIASITGSVTQGIALMTAGAAFAFDGKTESILLGISGAATLTTLALKVGLKGTAKNVQAYKAAGGGRGGVKAFLFGGLQRRTSIGGTTIQFEAGGNKIGRSKSLVPNKINKK